MGLSEEAHQGSRVLCPTTIVDSEPRAVLVAGKSILFLSHKGSTYPDLSEYSGPVLESFVLGGLGNQFVGASGVS